MGDSGAGRAVEPDGTPRGGGAGIDAAHTLCRRQLGLVLVEQLVDTGFGREEIRHVVRSGRLERVTRRVLRAPGAPRGPRQDVMVAILDASPMAFAGWSTGAALWDVAGHRLLPAHVVRGDGSTSRRSSLAVVHTMAGLGPSHVTVLQGIPVVRPELIVLQLCSTVHRARAAAALDSLWRRRLTSGPVLRAVLDELAGSGRDGVVAMRELLDERGDDYVPPASGLEGRFDTILRRAGEPPLRRQIDSGGDRWVGRVDFRDRDLPLLVEVQSEQFHTALVDRQHDSRRLADLRAAGFHVLEITDHQVWHQPDAVVTAVRAARRHLRARV